METYNLLKDGHSIEELMEIFEDPQELRDIYINTALVKPDFSVIRQALVEKIRNEIISDCRNKVRQSPERNFWPKENDTIVGYVYESDGRYKKYYLESAPDNIAKFIFSSNKEKFITSERDYALMNTIFGTYLDLSCAHPKYTKEVVEYLCKYQKKTVFQEFICK